MTLTFIVPGPLDQLTGGYVFDRRIIAELRQTGRAVELRELPGEFPDVDAVARRAAGEVLAALPEGAVAVIDGLALPAFIDCLPPQGASPAKLIGFIHHPLAAETGLAALASTRLAAVEMRLLPRLHGVLCPSAATAWAVEEYGVPRERIVITPPGVDRPAAVPQREERGGALRLLSVATVTPRKGHLLLIEALAALSGHPWELRCIGSLTRDPATVAAVKEAIARFKLEDRVTLAGEWPPERLGAAYAEADVFVLPSYHEGYGMAFADALAYGLPIIGTTAGAIPETVPAEAALLVPPGDGAALTQALRMILENTALRRRLAAGAAQAGAALPDWAEAAGHWAAALDRLTAS